MDWEKTFIFIIVGLAGVLTVALFIKESYVYGLIGLLAIAVMVYLMYRGPEPVKVLQIHEIIDKYEEVLEKEYQLTIERNKTVLATESLENSYLIVLKDMLDDGEVRYFPFECSKYEFLFGRGAGTMMHDIRQVKHWLLQHSQEPVKDFVFNLVANDIKNRYRQTFTEGDDATKRQFVQGQPVNPQQR